MILLRVSPPQGVDDVSSVGTRGYANNMDTCTYTIGTRIVNIYVIYKYLCNAHIVYGARSELKETVYMYIRAYTYTVRSSSRVAVRRRTCVFVAMLKHTHTHTRVRANKPTSRRIPRVLTGIVSRAVTNHDCGRNERDAQTTRYNTGII